MIPYPYAFARPRVTQNTPPKRGPGNPKQFTMAFRPPPGEGPPLCRARPFFWMSETWNCGHIPWPSGTVQAPRPDSFSEGPFCLPNSPDSPWSPGDTPQKRPRNPHVCGRPGHSLLSKPHSCQQINLFHEIPDIPAGRCGPHGHQIRRHSAPRAVGPPLQK